jgi:hypothetical protein
VTAQYIRYNAHCPIDFLRRKDCARLTPQVVDSFDVAGPDIKILRTQVWRPIRRIVPKRIVRMPEPGRAPCTVETPNAKDTKLALAVGERGYVRALQSSIERSLHIGQSGRRHEKALFARRSVIARREGRKSLPAAAVRTAGMTSHELAVGGADGTAPHWYAAWTRRQLVPVVQHPYVGDGQRVRIARGREAP